MAVRVVAVAVAVGLALVFARLAHRVLRAPTGRLPGPWHSRWTRVVLDFHFLAGTKSHYVHALHAQHGPLVRIGPNEVDVTDLEAVKVIYGIKNPFLKSPFYRRLATPGQESLFTTVNADFHRRHRRLLAGPMSESSLKSTIPTIDAHVKRAIQRMAQEMLSRGSADVFKWWHFMTTDAIGQLTFGDSFRMLELGHKNDYSFDLEQVARVGAIRATFPSMVDVSRLIPLPMFKQALKHDLNMRHYAVDSLQRYRRLVEANPGQVQQTLFTNLFKAEREDKIAFCEVRDEAQSYITAGTDTTAVSLTYLTWSVCRNPDIRAQLVAALQTLPPDFTEVQLRNLPFLNHVIDETMRLYSAAPSTLPRLVPPGGVRLAGHWFDEGTVVSAQAFSMHRDPLIFPQPDEFIPSRWISPTEAMRNAYMPFGRGPRVCLGLHLAQIELRLATARFFLAFPEARVSSLEGMSDSDMKPKIYVLLVPSGGRCLIQAA
ncbi:cytochrome p450 [Hirsutella rhossiliensis]|uniref:Cytochrome p450 domain-containing protein n=1 Tax=Hirsutella rhossiliensis TaxID=111463 RepID=A0A9P8SDN5_9HYPO|nr:cytochrome p450 domain-containing protein [Hirsutella rhossiliensis]KAH0958144.1 cytochrome p450 domain-containing protein [Hirsutella rhossiliensis]